MNDKMLIMPNTSKWSRSMLGGFKRGVRDFYSGKTLDDCPYQDHRKADGKLTWSRAYIGAWNDGWRFGKDGGTVEMLERKGP